MQQLIITQGLPASGKTTWALQQLAANPRLVRANRDNIRLALIPEGQKWKPSLEKDVTLQQRNIVITALDTGKSVIVDDTNLSSSTLASWRALANKHKATLELVSFTNIPLRTCIERDRLREGRSRVGDIVIQNMALRYGLIPWPTDRRIVIVDLDGTLANANNRLHHVRKKPKDWRSFFAEAVNDPVNEPVYRWVVALSKEFCIVLVTGRSIDQSQFSTLKWLERKQVPYDFAFMRGGYDHREDFEVKTDILKRMPLEQIEFSIDDRWQVVEKCWRAGGVKCYPVSETDGQY